MQGVRTPATSVGLPVFNGERFLAGAIESILNQSHSDLELIISDNASTDGTGRLAQDYERRDRRVRYFRQPYNVGIIRNHNFVLSKARGHYFKWNSASDYCAPYLLDRSTAVLDRDPKVVLCFGRTRLINEQGQELHVLADDFPLMFDDPVQRFLEITLKLTLNSPMNAGVIRTEVLRRAGPMGNYRSADVTLMSALSLYGCFAMLPEVTFFRRTGSEYSTPDRTPLEIERLVNPNANRESLFLATRRHLERISSVLSAPLAPRDKARALIAVAKLLYWGRRELLDELAVASRAWKNAK